MHTRKYYGYTITIHRWIGHLLVYHPQTRLSNLTEITVLGRQLPENQSREDCNKTGYKFENLEVTVFSKFTNGLHKQGPEP